MNKKQSYFIGTLSVLIIVLSFSCTGGLFSNVESDITGSWTSTPIDSALVERWFFNEEGRLFISRGEDTAKFYFSPLDTTVNFLEYLIDKRTTKSYVTITKLGQSLNMNVGPVSRKYRIITLTNDELYLSSEDIINSGETVVGYYQRSFVK